MKNLIKNAWGYIIGSWIALGGVLYMGTAYPAIYCYPHVTSTVCFSDQDGRSFETNEHVRNPNVIVVPRYVPIIPPPIYRPRDREVPEQDFGECTLALGCLKGNRQ